MEDLKAISFLNAKKRELEMVAKFPKMDGSHLKFRKGLEEINQAIEELENLQKKSCDNCRTEYKFCSIFQGANSNICLDSSVFYCSLHEYKKV